MKEIRVIAFFRNRKEVSLAIARLKKKCPNDYDFIHTNRVQKKIIITTNLSRLPRFPIRRTRSLLEESSANVLHHLNDCKGLNHCNVINNY